MVQDGDDEPVAEPEEDPGDEEWVDELQEDTAAEDEEDPGPDETAADESGEDEVFDEDEPDLSAQEEIDGADEENEAPAESATDEAGEISVDDAAAEEVADETATGPPDDQATGPEENVAEETVAEGPPPASPPPPPPPANEAAATPSDRSIVDGTWQLVVSGPSSPEVAMLVVIETSAGQTTIRNRFLRGPFVGTGLGERVEVKARAVSWRQSVVDPVPMQLLFGLNVVGDSIRGTCLLGTASASAFGLRVQGSVDPGLLP